MTDKEVYKKWFETIDDPRYLRPVRWQEMKAAIELFKVKTVLEFGSGVSTILLENVGVSVDSYETDHEYLEKVRALSNKRTNFHLWDNVGNLDLTDYDMGLVDGTLPRTQQFEICKTHCDVIAIDDFAGSIKNSFLPKLVDYVRIDQAKNFMAIFVKKDH